MQQLQPVRQVLVVTLTAAMQLQAELAVLVLVGLAEMEGLPSVAMAVLAE
jgi:hypothetical protein